MRILLDECVNPRVKAAFPNHDVKTVNDMYWHGATNGRLLILAEAHGFEVFVTVDQNISYQQHIAARRLGFIVVRVRVNVRACGPLCPELNRAAGTVEQGCATCVSEQLHNCACDGVKHNHDSYNVSRCEWIET